MVKVGIPKALLYYRYFPLWSTFLEELGVQVITSPPTNKAIIKEGVALAENEVCVPVKVFYGHVMDLKDKVDALFIPRVVSIEGGAYTCPKFLGLPDIIKAARDDLPEIMAPTFNLRLGWRKFYSSFYKLGRQFTDNASDIVKAFIKANRISNQYHQDLIKGWTPPQLLDDGKKTSPVESLDELSGDSDRPLRIGVVGHSYNVYDPFVSMNLVPRLRSWGVEVVTSEMIKPKIIEKEVSKLPKSLFWSYEKEVVGTAFHWLKKGLVDGLIYVLSFACGPDSLVQVLIEEKAKEKLEIPLTSIVLDEHTAEAGLLTRLEAFYDMISRKKGFNENYLTSHGQSRLIT